MVRGKYLVGILLAILMSISVISAIEPVSASKYKTIDAGKKIFKEGSSTVVSKQNTKSNGKTVQTHWKMYIKTPETKKYILVSNMKLTFKKVNKTKLTGTAITYKTKITPYSKESVADKTRLSAKSYYFKELKPIYTNPNKYF